MSSSSAALPVVREHALGQAVYHELMGRLISRAIEPGERIAVDAVSRELNVSQTPVREALARLEADGLVMKTHFLGYRATPPLTRAQFEDLFEMRMLLEPEAAAKAAGRSDERIHAAMLGSAEAMSHLAREIQLLSYSEFAREDAQLHDLIAEAGGNELLRESLVRLHPHLHLFRLHFHSTVSSAAISEHAELIDAIARRDARAARGAMKRHLESSRRRLRAAFA